MDILKKLNPLRRKVMRRLTKNIGDSSYKLSGGEEKVEVKRILISRPNHRLGNLLLITPLLQEIETTLPDCKVHLFVKGNLGPILFQNYLNVDHFIKLPRKPFQDLLKYAQGWLALKKRHYDVVMNIEKGSSSGRLSTQFANADYKFYGNINEDDLVQYPDQDHMAKMPVYHFRDCLSRMGHDVSAGAIPPLDLRLNDSERAEGKKILRNLVKNNKKTISLFTFATGSKCYSDEWWEKMYGHLKKEFPDHNIVEVLPVENVSGIGFTAPSFYSRELRQIGSFISNCDIFIGADSGIMHLASSVNTPTIGLFSVTNPDRYEPYNDSSIAVDTNEVSTDELMIKIENILSSNSIKKKQK